MSFGTNDAQAQICAGLAKRIHKVLKRQGCRAQDVLLLRHKWDATITNQSLAASQKLWQLEA